ncbi:hypothetical protein ABZV31_22335 [Streptomyces sp. NPDC005202]|uniref:hypothetical protein n=1 Tax=Streptomyces sp. NPDC005202 TaxID=3157021 RepID=UPI0033B81FC4
MAVHEGLVHVPGVQALLYGRDRLVLQFGRGLGEEVEEAAGRVGEAVVAAQGLGDGRAVAAPRGEVGAQREDHVGR